jgi:hypothetical protein
VLVSTMIRVLKTLVCCAGPESASLLIPRLNAEHFQAWGFQDSI